MSVLVLGILVFKQTYFILDDCQALDFFIFYLYIFFIFYIYVLF